MIKKTQKKKPLKLRGTFDHQSEDPWSFLGTAGKISDHFVMKIPTDDLLKSLINY